MAKKSAVSKGYRKNIKKKPFLTKKEIIALVAIVAAIIIAVILFNLFYGSGYLKASDVHPDDVVSIVDRDMKNRYIKVAESLDVDGFTRDNPYWDTNPASNFIYTPDEPTENISSIHLGGSHLDADALSESSASTVPSYSANGSLVATERYEVTVQGHDAYVYAYTNDYYQAPEDGGEQPDGEEEPESNIFNQTINLYVNGNEGRTIVLHIYRTGEDDSFYLPDDEIVDYILGYANEMFTVYEEPEKA